MCSPEKLRAVSSIPAGTKKSFDVGYRNGVWYRYRNNKCRCRILQTLRPMSMPTYAVAKTLLLAWAFFNNKYPLYIYVILRSEWMRQSLISTLENWRRCWSVMARLMVWEGLMQLSTEAGLHFQVTPPVQHKSRQVNKVRVASHLLRFFQELHMWQYLLYTKKNLFEFVD